MGLKPIKAGHIYFGMAYEDDDLRCPIIHSNEYGGAADGQPVTHTFRFLGSDDLLNLTDSQLDLVVTTEGLAARLTEWVANNPTLSK